MNARQPRSPPLHIETIIPPVTPLRQQASPRSRLFHLALLDVLKGTSGNTRLTSTHQQSASCPTPTRDEEVEEILSPAVRRNLQEPNLLDSLERPSFYVTLSPSTRANSHKLLISHVYVNDAKEDRLSTEVMRGGRGDGYDVTKTPVLRRVRYEEFCGVEPFEFPTKTLPVTRGQEPWANAHIDDVAAAEETQWEEKWARTVCYMGAATESEKGEMDKVVKVLGVLVFAAFFFIATWSIEIQRGFRKTAERTSSAGLASQKGADF